MKGSRNQSGAGAGSTEKSADDRDVPRVRHWVPADNARDDLAVIVDLDGIVSKRIWAGELAVNSASWTTREARHCACVPLWLYSV